MKKSAIAALSVTALVCAAALACLPQDERLTYAESEEIAPVAEYTFDGSNPYAEANGGTAAIARNVSVAEGKYGSAAEFSGDTSYLVLPRGSIDYDSITISAWLKLNELTNYTRLCDFSNSDLSRYLWICPDANGSMACQISVDGKMENFWAAGYQVPVGQWIHIAVTMDGNTGLLYVDGVLRGWNYNMTLSPSDLGETVRNYIGHSSYAGYTGEPDLDGYVDSFAVYDRVLTPAQLRTAADLTEQQRCARDVRGLTLDFDGENDVDLPAVLPYGSEVVWATSDDSAITSDGTVMRPHYEDGDKQVTLTATVTNGEYTDTKQFDLTVKCGAPADPADAQAVEYVSSSFDPPFSAFITGDISMPTTADFGITIAWTSSDEHTITTSGKVVRPKNQNENVTLTAEFSKGDASVTKTYEVQVVRDLFVKPVYTPADIGDITLTDGLFNDEKQRHIEYMLGYSYDADRLLRNFRITAGLEPIGEPYPAYSWEADSCELRGFTLGHYLSAAARLIASGNNPELERRANYIVEVLGMCQQANGGKYLSAFPETYFDKLENGEYVWAPYYQIHKFIEGLLDMYKYAGNVHAFEIACNLGDWVYDRNKNLTAQQHSYVLRMEYGGIGEAMFNLYLLTGKQTYLQAGAVFEDTNNLIMPVADGRDVLTGLHVNTSIPKFLAAARRYEVTGETAYRYAAINFFDMVMTRIYTTGGVGVFEEYFDSNEISTYLCNFNCESCNVYNLIKLASILYSWTGDAKYADYIERALYNQIAASINMETGEKTYYQSLGAGFHRYWLHYEAFECCNGSGLENFARLTEVVYSVKNDVLYVNQFMPTVYNWTGKNVTVTQATEMPYGNTVNLTVNGNNVNAEIRIRIPSWTKLPSVKINGTAVDCETQDRYIVLNRAWNASDVVEITFPMSLRAEYIDANTVAVCYGPVMLKASISESADGKNNLIPYIGVQEGDVEKFVDNIERYVSANDVSKLKFTLTDGQRSLALEPYYLNNDNRLIFYFRLVEKNTSIYYEYVKVSNYKVTTDYCLNGDADSVFGCNDMKLLGQSKYLSGLRYCNYGAPSSYVQYEFSSPRRISESSAYFWYDANTGAPSDWYISYWNDELSDWVQVANPSGYGKEYSCYNTVTFDAVVTTKVRIYMINAQGRGSALLQWKVNDVDLSRIDVKKNELKTLISLCENLDIEGYTAESIGNFNSALAFAKSVDGDSEYLWQRAIDMLETAKSNLVTKSDSLISVTYVFGKKESVTVLMSEKAVFKQFSPNGSKVSGWYIDEKLTRKYDFDTVLSENITLYAKLEKTQTESNGDWILPTCLSIGVAVLIAAGVVTAVLVKKKKQKPTSDE